MNENAKDKMLSILVIRQITYKNKEDITKPNGKNKVADENTFFLTKNLNGYISSQRTKQIETPSTKETGLELYVTIKTF